MMSEMNQVKRFLGTKFGYGEPIQDGIYAVPTETSKGNAFMRMEIVNGNPAGKDNFKLFWDEELSLSWYDMPNPNYTCESDFAIAFRQLEACR